VSSSKVFVRDSTGLVRTLSTADALWINLTSAAPYATSIFGILLMIQYFPGAYVPLSIIIGGLGWAALSTVYAFLSAAMPRSGGEYVYQSRVLHPTLGLGSSFNIQLWILTFSATNIFLVVQLFTRFLTAAGQSDLSNFVSQTNNFFIAGLICIIVGSAVMIVGLRIYTKLQWICVILAFVATVAVIFVLFSWGAAFPTLFNNYANPVMNSSDSYNQILNLAHQNGYTFNGYDVGSTIAATVGTVSGVAGSWWSNYSAGEIKRGNSAKVQLLSLPGATMLAAAIMALIAAGLQYSTGWDFLQGIVRLQAFSPSVYPLGSFAPTWDYFIAYLGNPAVVSIFLFGIFAASFLLVPVNILAFSRSVFAWSFDRILPEKLTGVSTKFGTPTLAITICAILTTALWYMTVYTTVLSVLAASILGFNVTLAIVAVTGILFPYRMKKTYEASTIKWNILGIPAVTLVGLVALIFILYQIYVFLAYPSLAALAVSSLTGGVIIGTFVLGFVLYYGARAYRKAKDGIDISFGFKEIPPE